MELRFSSVGPELCFRTNSQTLVRTQPKKEMLMWMPSHKHVSYTGWHSSKCNFEGDRDSAILFSRTVFEFLITPPPRLRNHPKNSGLNSSIPRGFRNDSFAERSKNAWRALSRSCIREKLPHLQIALISQKVTMHAGGSREGDEKYAVNSRSCFTPRDDAAAHAYL